MFAPTAEPSGGSAVCRLIQIVTTLGSQADAVRLAEQLIGQRLAACVQVAGPLVSLYRWQGKLERAEEWQCTLKTTEPHGEAAVKAILAAHPYELPEVLLLPVVGCSMGYQQWVTEQLTDELSA
jgi:periplasmic divalent cation tolerance protein